ncbi:MAG: ATP-binding SpoIIE family protein phosphatase, partial [Chloroflexota bacterium]
GHISIIVTELCTNFLKHAGSGKLIMRSTQSAHLNGVEILALDQGPGINNIAESLRDGFSTTGSSGTGLGAIQRMSSLFDIYSTPNLGSAVLSRVWRLANATQPIPSLHKTDVGVVCMPINSQVECGDNWAIRPSAGRKIIMLIDGLGHGHFAAEAAQAGYDIFDKYYNLSPVQIVEHMHSALRHTRGAVVAVAEILMSQNLVHFAGVGNISSRIISSTGSHNLISHNGTIGLEARKIVEFTYPWPAGGLLIMNSDGVNGHWNFDKYPGLRLRHPALIAGVLFRDYRRETDDATIIVFKEGSTETW